MKKLIPAIVMLLVSAVVLSTASYAWFTTAQDVTASGMQVTATAPTSVLIDGMLTGGYTGNFTSSIAFDQDATKLYAASSSDGKTFFVADTCTDTTGSMEYQSGISTVTNSADGGTAYYVDFKVKLKNTSADNAVDVFVKDINLAGQTIKNAVRVAIIEGDKDATVLNPADYDASYNSGYVNVPTADGLNEQPAVGPLYAASTGEGDGEWATKAAGRDTYAETDAVVVTLPQLVADEETGVAADNSVELTIRIWFEGQSAACVTQYAGLSAEIEIIFGMVANDQNS